MSLEFVHTARHAFRRTVVRFLFVLMCVVRNVNVEVAAASDAEAYH